MKRIFTLLILSLLFAACKTRHVATTKTDITTNEVLTRSVKKDSVKIDTGKSLAITKTKKDVEDSAEVIIQSDTGIQKITIAADGMFNYTGKAKSIVYKQKLNDHSIIDESLQVTKGEITRTTLTDTTADVKQSHQVTKTKIVDAKVDHGWIFAMIGVILLVCTGGYLAWKYKFG